MPTYGYECLGCSRNFEVFQKISDNSLTECEDCGGVLRKKIFPVGIVFKGNGFYVNDYAKKTEAAEGAASAKPEAAVTAPAAESSTEAPKAPEPKSAETKTEAPATPAAAPAKPAP